MHTCTRSTSLGILRSIPMLALCVAILAPVARAADFYWRAEAGSGDWDFPGENDSDRHWWDGASSTNAPLSAGCTYIQVDNDVYPDWNQNIADFSCTKILYHDGASSVRTLTGNGITFYDCSGIYPAIVNSSAVTHVIGALTGGVVASWNYPLELTTLSSGGLTIQSDMDNRGPSLNVNATTGTTVVLEGGVISATGGIVKAGQGWLTLNGTNTFSGGVLQSAGRVNIGQESALGTGAYTINSTGVSGFDNTSGGAMTISNAVAFSGGNPYFVGSSALTLAGPLTVNGASRTFTVSNNTATLTGTLGGLYNLIKSGTGTLALASDNSAYTGGVTLASGPLNIGHLNGLGTGALTLNGGVFDNTTGGEITLPNPIIIGSGNSTFAGTSSMTLTNSISLTGSRAVSVTTNSLTLLASIVESGAGVYTFTKGGNGTMVMNASNDLRGGIAVSTGGRFHLGHPNALGTGVFTCAATTLENTTGGPLTYSNEFKFNGNPFFSGDFHPLTFAGAVNLNGYNRNITISNNVFTFLGPISGTNFLAKYGSGTLALFGDNTYTLGFTLAGGTVNIGHSNALGSGPFTLAGGTFDNANAADMTVTNRVFFNGSPVYAGSVGNLELTGPVLLNNARTIVVSNRTLTLSGAVAGTNNNGYVLTKTGAGVLNLAGDNATLNGVFVTTGTLNIAHINALGTGVFQVGQATFDNTSAGPLVFSNGFRFNGSGSPANPTFIGTQPLTFTGSVDLTSSRTLTIAGGTLTFAGHVLNASVSLTKDGPGTLVLSGTNSHQSGTILSNGTLCLNHARAAGSGRLIIAGVSTLDNTSGGEITMANQHEWDADFSFGGANALNLGTNTVYLNGSRVITVSANTLTVGGTITVTNGLSSGLTKEGAGTLVIGKPVVYTGDTTVNDGTLELNGAGALTTSSNITVASGATLDVSLMTNGLLALTAVQTLKGGGTVVGTVTNAGTVAPGASPGILSVTGDYAQSGTLAIELSGTTPGSGHDVLAVGGNASLGGTLTVTTPSFTPSAGQSFTILTAATVSGTFATTNLPAGDWTVEVQADKVVLTVAGAPSSPILGVTPASLTFAATKVGEYSELTFTVTNNGAAQLEGTATVAGVGFSIQSGSPFSVAATGSASVIVRFTPTETMGYSGDVIFRSNGGDSNPAVSGFAYVQASATNGAITLVGGQPSFGFTLVSGALYRVQASTNLLDGAGWMDVTEYRTNNYPGGLIPAYNETNAATYPRRAYRISSP